MFPFNQPDKTKDCGYRCMYFVLNVNESYKEWLNQFRFFSPTKSGITFTDICTVLDYYKKDFLFTQIDEDGTYIIYSGNWLKPEKNHGHYFVYQNGIVYCSTKEEPFRMPLIEVIKKLESKNIDGAFRCLKIIQ